METRNASATVLNVDKLAKGVDDIVQVTARKMGNGMELTVPLGMDCAQMGWIATQFKNPRCDPSIWLLSYMSLE